MRSAAIASKQLLKNEIPVQSFAAWEPGEAVNSDEMIVVIHNRNEIRRLMWNYVGIVRTNKRLIRAKSRIAFLRKEITQYYWDFIINANLIELNNMTLVAELVIDSTVMRKETRGIHYSLDFPERALRVTRGRL